MEREDRGMLARYRGSLIGLAVGDAFGTTLECLKPTAPDAPQHTEMIGGGKNSLLPGQWTDDTSMALCLAESLLHTKSFDPADQIRRYLDWYYNGHLSSNGECFDIGITVRIAVLRFEKDNSNPYPAITDSLARQGNGSLMRLCPIPLLFRKDPQSALHFSDLSSRTTHGAAQSIDSCILYSFMILEAFQGKSKEEILNSGELDPNGALAQFLNSKQYTLCSDIEDIRRGSYKVKNPPEIMGTGHVVKTLEAALWAFYKFDTFEKGLIAVVNLGQDSDTTAAIYGQLAGAYYSITQIPEKWLKNTLALYPLCEAFADELYYFSEHITVPGVDNRGKDTEPVVVTNVEHSDKYNYVVKLNKVLEEQWAAVHRKLNPGPKMYRTMEDFYKDKTQFFATCFDDRSSLPTFKDSKEVDELLKEDFEKRFGAAEVKVSLRCSRASASK